MAVDKPCKMTSHDVVNKLRRALHERRIGHAGTLDPDASGVLVCGVGSATRLLGMLSADDKTYEARIVFGTQTTTDDAAGEVIQTKPVPAALLQADVARRALEALLGTHEQLPPAYSAISIDGVRAYELARTGRDPKLAPRTICVYEASLLHMSSTESAWNGESVVWDVRLHVSKGTYIRSIARDLGAALGTCAHIGGLRRLQSGSFELGSCVSLAQLEELQELDVEARTAELEKLWVDPAHALGYPTRVLTAAEMDDIRCGRPIAVQTQAKPQQVSSQRVSLLFQNKLVGVYEQQDSRLVCVVNLLDGISGVQS